MPSTSDDKFPALQQLDFYSIQLAQFSNGTVYVTVHVLLAKGEDEVEKKLICENTFTTVDDASKLIGLVIAATSERS